MYIICKILLILGKKSSGLVGQVYEMLNRYLDLLCESLVSGEPADKSSFAPEVSEQVSLCVDIVE